MEFRRLGPDAPEVSVLSLGSWNTYSRLSFEAGCDLIAKAIEVGINFFDIAYYRDKPHTEVLFGRLVQEVGIQRAEYVLVEKVWFFSYPEMPLSDQLARSLVRLNDEYVDVVLCEAPRTWMDLDSLTDEMAGLVESGMARHWGIFNWSANQLKTAHRRSKETGRVAPTMAQLKYSVARRSIVESPEYQSLFDETQTTLHASDTLEGGILAGRVERSRGIGIDTGGIRNQIIDRVPKMREIADSLGSTPAAVAMAFCLANPRTSSVLFGATLPSQIEDNLDALQLVKYQREQLLSLVEPMRVSDHTDEAPYSHTAPLTDDYIA